ncbi:MAG TPA: methylated-DNA--[protein]-cysteine S-methyltransferase [Candidatus Krumholzibacteria bacterium]|nr:methylated-DNA--[protein]-cysteine S-methyltransferase [Candidatus Krumholzibacteria bacterium]
MLRFQDSGRTVIDTIEGPVGLAWTPRGVARVVLADRDADPGAVAASLPPALPAVARPRGTAAETARRLRAQLEGRPDTLLDIPVDLVRLPRLAQQVLRALRKVPPGSVVSYGELARRARRPGAARAVGGILGANPVPVIVPCHRVLAADGSLTGFSAGGGVRQKARMLHREGHVFDPVHAQGMHELMAADPVMKRIIPHVGPYLPQPLKPRPAYDTLVQAIIHQQLSVKAGRTIAGRVRDLSPGPHFPRPEVMVTIPDATLRAAGLSAAKVTYVKDLASRVADGRLKLARLPRLDDDAALAALTEVKGIGRWSAQMHLMFHLGRLDVLPVDDVGLQNAATKAYKLDACPPARLAELGERWRPWRSLASWYLWQALDLGGL